MGVREQRRLDGRQAILRAAHLTVELQGASALTIRNVAADSGFSAPVVYQHFADKSDLLAAVATAGYDQLHTALAQAVAGRTGVDVLLALTGAYLDFAQQHPQLHRLMNGTGSESISGQARRTAARGVVQITTDAVSTWASTDDVLVPDPALAADLLWGLVQGTTTLGLLEDVGFARARELAADGVRRLAGSWR